MKEKLKLTIEIDDGSPYSEIAGISSLYELFEHTGIILKKIEVIKCTKY